MSENIREDEPLDKAAEMAARTVRAAGQAEKLAQTLQAAHAAAGAAKAGQAVSGAAAGTALAGPAGLIVGTLVTSKTFWKVIGAILLALFLFAAMIVNSIGILLSYLGFADADSYVAQGREAEFQNIKQQIETLLTEDEAFKQEFHTLLDGIRNEELEAIRTDYEDNQSGYDGYEVEDEYELVLKPALSQYLAVLIEESWHGSQIVGFNGFGYNGGLSGDLSNPYDAYFTLAAATYQVPEGLLKAMGKAESRFDPNVVSGAGAMGIMQLMPATARNLGVTDPFDPKQNIMGGAKYLSELLRTFSAYPDGVKLAVAGYNAGPGAVKRAGYRVPNYEETKNYVAEVFGYLNIPTEGTGEIPEEALEGNGRISAVLLKSLVEEKGDDFLEWVQTGTHSETVGSGEEQYEIEIVDYSVLVKLNAQLAPVQTGYTYRYVTDQTTFNYVLTLFDVMQSGTEGVTDLLFKAASWKNYILGEGASEDIYTSTIQVEGDTIAYETVNGCVEEVTYYNQGEEPWASVSYGSGPMRETGCGPTALAIVISTLKKEAVTPDILVNYSMSHGGYVAGRGTSHSLPSKAAEAWGLSVNRVKKEAISTVVSELKKGKLAVVICAENTISGSSGHYIVLTGVTDRGYLTIADPGSRGRTGSFYSPATIQSYARDLADGSIWIIGD